MSHSVIKGEAEAGKVGRSGWRRRPTAKSIFLLVLLLVLAAYTEIAFGMEATTASGRIGAGFFPRVIGGSAALLTLIALVQSMRVGSGEDDDTVDLEEDMGEGDLGHHPKAMIITIALTMVFVATLTTLGAIVSGVLFMFALLWFLNRTHLVTNIVLSLGLPLAMYLLFQTFLNSGLPEGILPRF
ncbi:tripartite tricarboxylate transporter TctB family protein [Arthrobacter sp. H41]|uniref:tripartite tricarboxylate transporter TctB family protein n=1 Tax=Arthrobacter sp. H41 TaxID=1312978 RepID=UPI00047AC720|nr:tripartite tricarboxylate transporter TctB family protein [Arthrobacter sp. H41]